MAQPAMAPPGSLAAAIERASALLPTDAAGAGREAEAILKLAPNDPRALLILGSARRRTGDIVGAEAVLAPLALAYPRAALTQYELGLVLGARGEEAAAVAALRQAVTLNRELPDAWRALGDRLFAAGDLAGAERAFAEHARAAVRDPALRPAAEAVFAGRAEEAEHLLRGHIALRPNDTGALQMLAKLFGAQGRHSDAEILLAHALELDPALDGARFAYAEALFRQQKAAEAIPQVERLLATDPADPVYRNLLAACLGLVGEEAEETRLYEALLADFPRQPKIWLNYGHALRTLGRRDESVAAYKRCIALAPDLGDAYWSLANLKVAAFEPAEVAAMQGQLARAELPEIDRLHLSYALGKALEDSGEDAEAFRNYAAGAAIRRAQGGYDADETTAQMRRSKALFTPEFFAARAGSGAVSSAATPIFVIGLPRSGSTLVEQILASHSAVEGTMELPDIGLIAWELDSPEARYPLGVADLDPAELAALGEAFLARTRVHRKLGRPFFVDKMPNNFQHLGLIALILPGARIVDVRRHPLGCGFSAFKQHFAQGQAFSYDLTDLGRYYADYVALMRHMDAVLPGRVCRLIYEDLIDDTEGQVRRLLDHCGLPFEAACLDFHRNDRAVRTVSSEQVRRPIFREGVDQWRRFEPWLDPLKAALGDTLADWRA
ncbi:tetratricopeptide repeat-containing sulfotransferase family protein [Phenylobacterium sp.]|uniref:tetratricopeptide repeat-containing sulfotransferase family protein n=1 Tax=Phenylobacterium sp. TaxID=1871053 RepID=UPI0025E43FC4|nr:tetratricopeptide repeat-containing sulfotransferase family protein [Phenylobacterium sp.]